MRDHVVRELRAGTAVNAPGTGGVADVVLPWASEVGHGSTVIAIVQNPQSGDVPQALAWPLTEPACAKGT